MDTVWIDARAKKYFKFENVRITNNKCAEVMGGGVALGRRRYKRFRCVPNILKMCERKLTEWSQVSFPNGRKKIEALKDKLAQL